MRRMVGFVAAMSSYTVFEVLCVTWYEIMDVHTGIACLAATLKAGSSFKDEIDTRKPFRRCTASDTSLGRYHIKLWDTIPLRSGYLHVRMRRRPVECFDFASVPTEDSPDPAPADPSRCTNEQGLHIAVGDIQQIVPTSGRSAGDFCGI